MKRPPNDKTFSLPRLLRRLTRPITLPVRWTAPRRKQVSQADQEKAERMLVDLQARLASWPVPRVLTEAAEAMQAVLNAMRGLYRYFARRPLVLVPQRVRVSREQ